MNAQPPPFDRLLISPYEYSIDWKPLDHWRREGREGYHDPIEKRIEVVCGNQPIETFERFVHELFHALIYVGGFKSMANEEEPFTRGIATLLVSVFKMNPQVVKWIGEVFR